MVDTFENRILREQMEADVLQHVTNAVEETIQLRVPEDWSDVQCKAVEDQIMSSTRIRISELTKDELRSPRALHQHIDNAVAETKRLIHGEDKMTNTILHQLARTTLLPADMATAILAGNAFSLEEVVEALLIGAMDAEAVVAGDFKSTWNERRIARQALIVAFLAALAVSENDPKQDSSRIVHNGPVDKKQSAIQDAPCFDGVHPR